MSPSLSCPTRDHLERFIERSPMEVRPLRGKGVEIRVRRQALRDDRERTLFSAGTARESAASFLERYTESLAALPPVTEQALPTFFRSVRRNAICGLRSCPRRAPCARPQAAREGTRQGCSRRPAPGHSTSCPWSSEPEVASRRFFARGGHGASGTYQAAVFPALMPYFASSQASSTACRAAKEEA